ncbi:hypothetical protein Ddc_01831 [Ditylenchus destructor]|nr:hypothetical protein Ddc_01831 [Ditylenchus destructor]
MNYNGSIVREVVNTKRGGTRSTPNNQVESGQNQFHFPLQPVMATVGWEELGMIEKPINDDNSVWPRPSLTGILLDGSGDEYTFCLHNFVIFAPWL